MDTYPSEEAYDRTQLNEIGVGQQTPEGEDSKRVAKGSNHCEEKKRKGHKESNAGRK